MEHWALKHVSNSTWSRLKEEAAVPLFGELHHDARGVSPAAPDAEISPIGVQRPVDSSPSNTISESG